MLKGTEYVIVIIQRNNQVMFWCSNVFFFFFHLNLSAQLSDELFEEVFVETVLMEGDKAIEKIALVCKKFKDIVSTERFRKRAHYRWLNSKLP